MISYPVADSAHSFNKVSRFTQLLAKGTYVDIYSPCFPVKIISPYMAEDLIS